METAGLLGFVASAGDTAFVVFRGTVLPLPGFPYAPDAYLSQLRGWLTNFSGAPVDPEDHGPGKVHQGFQQAVCRLRDTGLDLNGRTKGKRQVVWTGHSLGAALATVAATITTLPVESRQAIVSFGGPRVGDAAFVASIGVDQRRFVLGRDMVAVDPPSALMAPFVAKYAHHGKALPVLQDGESPSTARVIDMIDSQIGLDEGQKLAGVLIGAVDAPIRDHAPVLYAAGCERRTKGG